MRHVLLYIVLFTLPLPALSGNEIRLGVVGATMTSIYQGADSAQYLFPLLIYEQDRFYFHATQGGYRVWDAETGSMALEVRRTFDGYQASDSPALEAMTDRGAAWEAGLAFEHAFAGGNLKANIMQDISHSHDGFSARLEYEHPWWSAANLMLSWYGGAEFFDDTKSDYYFGVTAQEARPERPEYHPGSTWRYFGGSHVIRRLAPQLDVMAGLEYLSLCSGVTQSPIVSRSGQITVYAGITYRF